MKRLLVLILFLFVLSPVAAQEIHTLTVPTTVTTTTYTLSSVTLDVENLTITVQVKSNVGTTITKIYTGSTSPTGATLLHNLNTGNFSTNSLVKAVYNRLLTDGVLPAGSISGSPQ